jgi:general secretion pathway protein G
VTRGPRGETDNVSETQAPATQRAERTRTNDNRSFSEEIAMTAIRTYKSRKGFTLVEILIVVIILGILAAIVIPQFTNASQDARRSSLASTVQSVRSQVELYKLQHGDTLPNILGAAADNSDDHWKAFTTQSQWPVGSTNNFGPYMQSAPSNQLMSSSAVADGTAAVSAGFVYDYAGGNGTGRFWGIDKATDGTLSLLGD